MFAEVNQRIYDLCVDMLGPAGLVDYDYEMKRTAGLALTGAAGYPAGCSCVLGPTRSKVARRRSSATSWANGSSVCRGMYASTRTCPGRGSPASAMSTDSRRSPVTVPEEVADGVWAFAQQDGSWWINTAGFVVGSDRVTSIDACATEARTRHLLNAISQVTDRPVRALVNTHAHGDHTYGNCLFTERPSWPMSMPGRHAGRHPARAAHPALGPPARLGQPGEGLPDGDLHRPAAPVGRRPTGRVGLCRGARPHPGRRGGLAPRSRGCCSLATWPSTGACPWWWPAR